MPGTDPTHWLYRLDGREWLAAAEGELAAARRAAVARQQRAAVTQARLAAGMALNALLVAAPDPAYGRSYMDHIQALARDDGVREDLRQAAQRLIDTPLAQELVPLGRAQAAVTEPAALIIEYVRGLVAPPARA